MLVPRADGISVHLDGGPGVVRAGEVVRGRRGSGRVVRPLGVDLVHGVSPSARHRFICNHLLKRGSPPVICITGQIIEHKNLLYSKICPV